MSTNVKRDNVRGAPFRRCVRSLNLLVHNFSGPVHCSNRLNLRRVPLIRLVCVRYLMH